MEQVRPLLSDAARSCNTFALDLVRSLTADVRGNVFVSPLSIAVALTAASGAASGTALEEMRAVLYHDRLGDEDAVRKTFSALCSAIQFRHEREVSSYYGDDEPEARRDAADVDGSVQACCALANSLWMRGSVSRDFVATTAAALAADVKPLGSVDDINSWICERTRGLIERALEKVDPDALLVLVNAVYFRAPWAKEFSARDTCPRVFRFPGGDRSVPTMELDKAQLDYYENDLMQAVRLGYKDGSRTSACILLPRGDKTSVDDLLKDAGAWPSMKIRGGDMERARVTLRLPRMKVSCAFSLVPSLSPRMPSVFRPGGMLRLCEPGDPLAAKVFVSDVVHKAVLEVDEVGTKAAAVTAVCFRGECYRRPPALPEYEMNVDRPFLYIIEDNETGAIIFLGRITDPVSE